MSTVDERSVAYLSPKQAALRLGVCTATIYRAVAAGELEAVRLTKRGAIRIPLAAIEREPRQ